MFVADSHPSRVGRAQKTTLLRRCLLAAAGLVVLALCAVWAGKEESHWLPSLGLGLALVAWLGQGMVPLVALDLYLTRIFFRSEDNLVRNLAGSLLLAV